MARKYLRIAEVVKICGVDQDFLHHLERESVVRPIFRQRRKLYPPDQVDRVRVAHVLMEELGVNLEGAEVVLHMRAQMIALQRQLGELMRRLERTKPAGDPLNAKQRRSIGAASSRFNKNSDD
jgi:MerR family transcriptional regulator/heat shock protein HspR